MKILKSFFAVALLLLGVEAFGQSNSFNMGQNLEIQYSILKSLGSSYVDSVKYGKIMPLAIESMLQSLDPYTTYIPEEYNEDLEMMTTGIYGGVGALIRKNVDSGVTIVEPYFCSPATKAGLEPGDVILEIDGVTAIGETSDQSSSRMKGQPGTDVKFKVVKGRSGDTLDVTVTRERIHVSDIAYSGIIRDSIGYIKITGFTDKMSSEFKSKVNALRKQGVKRLVIDLRDNGGGIMDEAVNMASLFLPKGTMVVTSHGRDTMMNQKYLTKDNPVDTLIPLLVMVNSGTASASEIFSGAMQDLDRGTVAGKRTFGKGLIQTILPTPYNGKVKLTTGKYYTPSGRCVQALDYSHRNEDGSVGQVPDSLKSAFKTRLGRTVYDGGGITPDIEVEPHIYSRTAIALAYSGIMDDYAVEFYKRNPQIAPLAEFRLSDEEYDKFVEYASTREFDSRTAAESALDALIKAAKQDKLYDQYKDEIEALSSKVRMDKATVLKVKMDEIKPLLEGEIVVKYYFEGSDVSIILRHDTQLHKALDQWQ